MKLTRKFYYTKMGEQKINNYFLYIPTKIAQEVGFDEKTELKISNANGKIIIEKK